MMFYLFIEKKCICKDFGKQCLIFEVLFLFVIQVDFYCEFLQENVDLVKCMDYGLYVVLKLVFLIFSYSGNVVLEYVGYKFGDFVFDECECCQCGMSYGVLLCVIVCLVIYDCELFIKVIKYVKEQEVYFGEILLMIENGIFIVNGIECVIVLQLYCLLGVFFDYDCGKIYSLGKLLYSVCIIFYCGFWLDFEFDLKDVLFICIDCCCKLLVLILLCVLGYSNEEMLVEFFEINMFYINFDEGVQFELVFECLCGEILNFDLVDGDKVIVEVGKCIIVCYVKQLEVLGIVVLVVLDDYIVGCILLYDVVDVNIGELLVQVNDEIIDEQLQVFCKVGVDVVGILWVNDFDCGLYLFNILCIDLIKIQLEVLVEIYCMMCLGELLIKDVVQNLFYNLFFIFECYDLFMVGCMKFNCCVGCKEVIGEVVLYDCKYFGECNDEEFKCLVVEYGESFDILDVIKVLIEICNGCGVVDDIDYLGNCCVCLVGEMVENVFCVGLVCVECVVKECLLMVEFEGLILQELINVKLVVVVIKEFFGFLQLFQFMDQNNLLLEVMYKCCVFVLGLGGLICECVGFEVCDVYLIYYGCVCIIEILEGLNIGLINLLVVYVCINQYGFFEILYCKVFDGKVFDEIEFLLVIEENEYVIVQVNVLIDVKSMFIEQFVLCCYQGELLLKLSVEVYFMDVLLMQIVLIVVVLVLFLEYDDVN